MPAKKVKGRKRHIVVDTQGWGLAVVVHPANVQDRDGAKLVLQRRRGRFPDLRRRRADGGYAGALETWVAEHTPWVLDIVRKDPQTQGFAVLPQRWIVERTFAWRGRHRRLSTDYEARPDTSEAWIYIAMMDRMLERLAAAP